MSPRHPETQEDRQRQRMREAGCDPVDHTGPINIRIEMGEEVTVDKYCAACDTDVEGWSYDPPVESVALELADGRTERFNRSQSDSFNEDEGDDDGH